MDFTPRISITDHIMNGYTHNIVVSFRDMANGHYLEYCTHVDNPRNPSVEELHDKFKATLDIISLNSDNYIFSSVVWSDDF